MKTLASMLALMAYVGLSYGQGSVVNFNNNGVAVGGDHKVYFGTVGGVPVTGTNYVAELYYLDPVTSSLTPFTASISKFRVTTTSSVGTWSGKTVTVPIGGLDQQITLDVKVWDNILFATYEAALAGNGVHGESGPFAFKQILSSPPATSDTQLVNMPAFAITVPEPSAIALGVIGVAGLLLVRRRK